MFQAAFSVVFPGVGFSVEIQTTNPRIVSLLVMQSIIKAFGSDCDYDGPSEMARLALNRYISIYTVPAFGGGERGPLAVILVLSCTVSEILQVICAPGPTHIPPLFLWCFSCTRSPMLESARAEALSYSAVKLFSKYSNLCENNVTDRQTDGRTDGQTTYCRINALCVTSRDKQYTVCDYF